MADNANELLELKKKIDGAKAETQRLTGQLDQLVKQRGNDFGVASDEEAETYLEELTAKTKELEQEISEGLKTIKEELGWDDN